MIRRLFLIAALVLGSLPALAQLSTPQIATLRANILADLALASKCVPSGDGPFDIAVAYNLPKAAPTYTVWRTVVPAASVGDAMNSSEVAGLTTANTNRLMVMQAYSGGSFNASRTDTRSGFDSVFSGAGGVLTRANLLIVWKRLATRAEALFATGTGTDAVPGLLVFEGILPVSDVQRACTQ